MAPISYGDRFFFSLRLLRKVSYAKMLLRRGGEVANTAVCRTAIRGCKSRSRLSEDIMGKEGLIHSGEALAFNFLSFAFLVGAIIYGIRLMVNGGQKKND